MGIFLSKTLMKEAELEREKYEPSKDKFDPNKVQRGNVPKTVKNGETLVKEAEYDKGEPKSSQNKELPGTGYVPKTVMKGK